MTRVKVCGLTTAADRDAAIDAGADALGFLVDVPVETERELSPARAAELIADVPPFVASVLVTMPDSAERALELVEATGADAVQLHNDLPVDAVAAVADGADARVLKAVDADLAAAERYAPVADALLVDSRTAEGAGGTGRRGDWERAAELRAAVDVPVVLAGGLTPDNVAAAVDAVAPYAVDVSSGVERAEGRKDHDAVRAFVAAADRRPLAP
ncbi:MAG: phosphoribosylanthranilate isomerase [Halobacteriales archaeon]|nr:phosphoribosylanthranilate isomerase [Halobacteriales archaeon]